MRQRLIEFDKSEKRLENAVIIVNDESNVEISFWYNLENDDWYFERKLIEFEDISLAASYIKEVSDKSILEFCKSYL